MQILDNAFLVTGAGSGLGAATAKMIADEGGKVVIADVAQAGEQVAKELGAKGRYVKCDVTEESSMQAAVEACVASFGAIHGLVNCAGVAPGERVVGRNGPHSLASFQRAVMVNLVGTFNAIRLAAARMSVQPAFANGERGVIVNTSSVASFEGQVGQAAYSASKAGVNGMTLPVARELAKFGIRVMTIAPGIFDTPMLRGMSEEVRASLGQQVPFPARLGRPEEYASLVREIIANEVLNGAVIRLDGAIRMAAK